MPSPSTALASQRNDLGGSLEEFGLAADRMGFIGLQALPVFETAKQSGNFGKIPIEELLKNADTKRAPGSGYSRGEFTFLPASYACEEHGHEAPVDDRQAEMYRDYFDAELVATEQSRDVVLRNLEKRIAALLFNAATWTPTTITNEWDDYTNATPIDDVEAAVQAVYDASGLWPNALVINRKVFRNLRNCDQVIDRVKYQGYQDARAGNITVSALAEVFDLPKILVGGGTQNGATEGQAATPAPIWSDEYALVARVAMSGDIREPCVGRTLHWSEDGSDIGTSVESYRDERTRSDIIRSRMDTDELILYTEAAHLLDNVTT